MAGELTVRPYVPGQDDEAWVGIYNRARVEAPEFVPERVEDLRLVQQAPGSDRLDEQFLAEQDGVVVGRVAAFYDAPRKMPVGYLDGPDVVPEARRCGIGSVLMRQALESLRRRGAPRIESGAGDWNTVAQAFLRKHGFEPTHTYSRMTRDLAPVSGVGENQRVTIQPFGVSDEEVATHYRLFCAAFAEYHNFTPISLERWTYFARRQHERGRLFERYFAVADGQPVGFLIIEIDQQENQHLGVRRGWVNDIGVLKEFRGLGIATRLLVLTLDRLRALGMESAVLSVDDQNVTNARRVYERVGFRVARRFTSFELPLAPLTETSCQGTSRSVLRHHVREIPPAGSTVTTCASGA